MALPVRLDIRFKGNDIDEAAEFAQFVVELLLEHDDVIDVTTWLPIEEDDEVRGPSITDFK